MNPNSHFPVKVLQPTFSTYRIRYIPSSVDKTTLRDGLARVLGVSWKDIQVHSLARCISPYEEPQTYTATVTIKSSLLEIENTVLKLDIPEGTCKVVIDRDFQGLTPLNNTGSTEHLLE